MIKQENLSKIDPWLEPYHGQLQQRVDNVHALEQRLTGDGSLAQFALGYLYFGLHATETGWVLREWAPAATNIYLVCEASNWKDSDVFAFTPLENGQWELVLPKKALAHRDEYKLHIHWHDGSGYRIPAWATRVVQDDETNEFNAQVWQPRTPYAWSHKAPSYEKTPLLVYEAHIGMGSKHQRVATYREFTRDVLPRIKADGYNTVQLMAVQEHPYYGSFGYHVTSYFAASSRYGTPEDLKALVDTAHGMGLRVILDIVHSHAAKNEVEGLSNYDGTEYQFFHKGPRGNHDQWDSRVFDYAKPEVLHFLLSNCRYWLDEYQFDGFRFDGVTSMLYTHHGMSKAFTHYDDYFHDTDPDALAYLTLANTLIHAVTPHAVTIAEEMSGLPGIAGTLCDGGVGFDYRMNMGVPDLWIKYIKDKRDDDWNMSELLRELTSHRPEERVINYAESHDQALVGDKTVMFRLADKDMYDHMLTDDANDVVERAVALHKLIRLVTAATQSGGYLNFMGNEFGHPEWIDFPREGNEWSYTYARRQWQLADDPKLKYHWLGDFDKAMTQVVARATEPLGDGLANDGDHVMAFTRGEYVFACNFHPTQSYTDYGIKVPAGSYKLILSSDDERFGGQQRIDSHLVYESDGQIKLYLPARTAIVLMRR